MEYGAERPTKRRKIEINKGNESRKDLLPPDVITSILARLPARSLQKLRCVCRSWDLLIQEDPYLVSQHLNYQLRNDFKKTGIVRFSCTQRLSKDYTLNYSSGDNEGSSLERKFDFSKLLHDSSYFITNSCDGMVGVFGHDSFYIANPSIRKVRALPQGSPMPYHWIFKFGIPQAGLGFDGSSREYKVVRLFDRVYKGYMGCEVLPLGSSNRPCSWRLVDDPPIRAKTYPVPVLANGVLYWTVEFNYNTPEIALSFDLSQEKFSVILHPEGSSKPQFSSVVSLGGCVCIADTLPSERMNVWVLKDHKDPKWIKQYNIDLFKLYKPLDEDALPLSIDNGMIVLYHSEVVGGRYYYDLQAKRFVKRKKIRNVDCEAFAPYTESIVWPWSRFCVLY